MKVTPLDIEGAWLIEAQTHKDNRGLFREWFRSDASENSMLPSFEVIQANTSVSEKGAIRGIHYSDAKNGSAALPGSVTSADFDLSPGNITALTGV
jgi:dTDP-4-dehydrorhamnose 3,5-epimerase-like enzyme